MRLEALRGQVVEALRALELAGLVHGTSGNVSARDPGSGLVAVSPTSMPYATMGAADVSVVDREGRLVEGRGAERRAADAPCDPGRPARGRRDRPHALAVRTALGLVVDEIPVVLAETAAAAGGPVPVVPYAPTGERAMGEAVLSAGDGWAAIVRNHGPVCLGRDLREALRCAFAVEEAARAFALARPFGEPAPLPAGELERLRRLSGR